MAANAEDMVPLTSAEQDFGGVGQPGVTAPGAEGIVITDNSERGVYEAAIADGASCRGWRIDAPAQAGGEFMMVALHRSSRSSKLNGRQNSGVLTSNDRPTRLLITTLGTARRRWLAVASAAPRRSSNEARSSRAPSCIASFGGSRSQRQLDI
jgi:hypothetical protein